MARIIDYSTKTKTISGDYFLVDNESSGTKKVPADDIVMKSDVDSVPTQGSSNAVSSGGVYSALQNIDVSTDTTLSVSGKPADAKAVGDALADKVDAVSGKGLSTNDYSDTEKQKVMDATTDLTAMTSATAGDVGKALKAKTVSGGKVTEWEFGEAGGSDEGNVPCVDKLMGDFYDYTPASVSTSRNGYAIEPVTGCYVANSAYTTKGYNVTAGSIIKVVSDYLFQFQNGQSTPATSQPSVRVGETFGAGTYYLEVPENANALKISTDLEGGIGACYTISTSASETVEEIKGFINDKAINSRIDMATTLSDEDSQQAADISNSQTSAIGTVGLYTTNNVRIDLSKNGAYYTNPFGNCKLYGCRLYDSEGNALTLTNISTGASVAYITESQYWSKIERVDDTHISLTNWNSEILYKTTLGSTTTYELSGTVSYAITSLRHMGEIPAGITYSIATKVYIPMGMNLQYNGELSDAVWNDFLSNKRYYDAPNEMFNAKIFRSYALSDNIFDDDLIDFANHTAGGAYMLKPGRRVPVIGGKTIISNTFLNALKAYDSEGNQTDIGNKGAGLPITLPNDAVEISFFVSAASWGSANYRVVSIWYLDENKLYPTSDVVRNALPMAQVNGWEINKNLYNYCIPDVDAQVVLMMKTFAIRELNHQRNALRVGTFNVYVNRQATNKEVIRKMMGTYGIDLCGFQESQNYQSGIRYNLGDYLRGWQFGYCSTAEEDLASARHIVSALEIASSEAFSIGTGTNTCLKCVINMPRYKDYKDGLTTLSFYTYHGIVSSDAERILEVNDILAKVAVDTSDFIIVCGDTNDFSGQPNYTHDRWAQFQAAGLTPVHDGSSETVTDRTVSIDNIFISSNIRCLYYDVVNSGNWMYKPTSSSSPVPVSDHDFVYADLQFDFEAAIEARNQGGA